MLFVAHFYSSGLETGVKVSRAGFFERQRFLHASGEERGWRDARSRTWQISNLSGDVWTQPAGSLRAGSQIWRNSNTTFWLPIKFFACHRPCIFPHSRTRSRARKIRCSSFLYGNRFRQIRSGDVSLPIWTESAGVYAQDSVLSRFYLLRVTCCITRGCNSGVSYTRCLPRTINYIIRRSKVICKIFPPFRRFRYREITDANGCHSRFLASDSAPAIIARLSKRALQAACQAAWSWIFLSLRVRTLIYAQAKIHRVAKGRQATALLGHNSVQKLLRQQRAILSRVSRMTPILKLYAKTAKTDECMGYSFPRDIEGPGCTLGVYVCTSSSNKDFSRVFRAAPRRAATAV